MAKSNQPRRRMDRYFKNLQRNAYMLSYNKKGSCTTKISKWDVIRRLTKKIVSEDEQTGIIAKELHNLDPGVHQLLPRQDVQLYGTIPALEQRVYTKCKNCSRVFNPRHILSHRNCSKTHTPHSSSIKKKVKSKNGNSKKPSSNGNSTSNLTSSNTTGVTAISSAKETQKDFVFKRPYTPPSIVKVVKTTNSSKSQQKVSVTKVGISKVAKTTPVTTSTRTLTSTTSSDKSDTKVSSSKVTSSVHHSPKSPSSGHHSSKSSSAHSPRSLSSSQSSSSSSSSASAGHHGPKSPSSHHSPKSPSSSSSHRRSKSPSSIHHSPRSPSKSSHHGSSHHSSSSSHHSTKSSSSKSTPMDTLPPSSSSSSHHHHSSSSSSHSSSRHKKSSSSSSKRSSSNVNGSRNSSSSSSKVLPKNYDPDIHCGVTEGNRGTCMRSITCSNHRLHLRKQVSGRSKDIHQLIAERKAAKENDLKHTAPPCSYTAPNGEAKDILSSKNTAYVPVVAQVASTSTSIDSSVTNSYVRIRPRVSGLHTRLSTTSVLSKKLGSTGNENQSAKFLTNGYISRSKNINSNVVGTVPVVIMPVNPVVVSTVQLIKIGNKIISLEAPKSAANPQVKKQVILPITGNQSSVIRMYKSHPKPIILPNFGARRLGGAILLANPLLKGGVKFNCKRPASDKLPTSDSKRLVPDVNGFILHADISETASAPQYSGESGPSQHELIISLINKYGF